MATDGPGDMHVSLSLEHGVGLVYFAQGGDSADVPPDGQFHVVGHWSCTLNFTADQTVVMNVGYGLGDWKVTIHRS